MKKTLLAVLVGAFAAHSQATEIRSMGMGGVSTVGGNYLSAVSSNPALLASQAKVDDDFGFILPGASIELQDPDDLFNAIDEFQDAYDTLEGQVNSGQSFSSVSASRDQLVSKFANLDTQLNVGVNASVVFAGHTSIGSFALFAQSKLDMIATTDVAQSDITALNSATSVDEVDNALDTLASTAGILAANVAEAGVTYANNWEVDQHQFSVGVTLKTQRVDIFNYQASVSNFDEDDFDADEYLNDDSGFNIDLGATYLLSKDWTVGLSLRNMIASTYQSNKLLDGSIAEYEISPELSVGTSYEVSFLTLAADLELIASEKFSTDTDNSQYFSVGAEADMLNWAQLRLGYKHDLEGNYEDKFTFGLGLSPFGVMHLDLGAQYASDRRGSVGAQLSFTF